MEAALAIEPHDRSIDRRRRPRPKLLKEVLNPIVEITPAQEMRFVHSSAKKLQFPALNDVLLLLIT